MSDNPLLRDKPGARIGRAFLLVEWLAASVLVLVMLLVGWLLVVSYWPAAETAVEPTQIVPDETAAVNASEQDDVPPTLPFRLASERIEVILILTLLTAALVLVSVVALRHTRD